jgi:kinesin family protein 5
MEGFNGTVFAYGQTSSGKTHTMSGPSIDDPQQKGVIPRMVNTIFEKIEAAESDIEFTVKISMIEIYNEKVKDLLNPTKSNLKIAEEKMKGIYIKELEEAYVGGEEEVY